MMATSSPALCALMSGFTTRFGMTRRSLIPISVKMLILTPAAKAEIHSMTGTNVKKTASRMIPAAIISKRNSVDGSIIFLLKM
ncbi:Secreted protein [Bacillus sp. IT-13CA1]